jgi:hypothetical protein
MHSVINKSVRELVNIIAFYYRFHTFEAETIIPLLSKRVIGWGYTGGAA